MVCEDSKRRRQHLATTAHRALPVCEWPALGMPWGNEWSNPASAVAVNIGELALGPVSGLSRWFGGVKVLPVYGDLQRWRQHSATTVHKALPVCE